MIPFIRFEIMKDDCVAFRRIIWISNCIAFCWQLGSCIAFYRLAYFIRSAYNNCKALRWYIRLETRQTTSQFIFSIPIVDDRVVYCCIIYILLRNCIALRWFGYSIVFRRPIQSRICCLATASKLSHSSV